MKKASLQIGFMLLLLLFSGCLSHEDETNTTTLLESTTTEATTSTTTTSTTTTSLSYLDIDSAGECEDYADQEERDNCYLTLAVNKLDMTLCENIEKTSRRKLCEMLIGGEKTGSAEVTGYVLKAGTRTAIKGVEVYAISQETGEQVASDTTNSRGYYSMDVGSGVRYNITVVSDGKEYTQTQFARNGYEHEVWFVIP